MTASTHDAITVPGGLDDCPAVRQHLAEQRIEFRASMARMAQALHPDDTVPAGLELPPHRPQLGIDLLHRHPYVAGLLLGALCGAIAAGWL